MYVDLDSLGNLHVGPYGRISKGRITVDFDSHDVDGIGLDVAETPAAASKRAVIKLGAYTIGQDVHATNSSAFDVVDESGVSQLTGSAAAAFGPDETDLSYLQDWTGVGTVHITNTTGGTAALTVESEAYTVSPGSIAASAIYGIAAGLNPNGVEGDAIALVDSQVSYALNAYIAADGAGVVLDDGYGVYVQHSDVYNGAVITTFYSFFSKEQTAAVNNYYSWHDSRGVRRVKDDSTFDSVGQAIEALYNPQFAKYTAGAANYERVILGQWNANVAEIGTEKGGTGTLRATRLIGSEIQVQSGKSLLLGNAAVTGLTAGVLAALTNASIVIKDSGGQAYRVPCII